MARKRNPAVKWLIAMLLTAFASITRCLPLRAARCFGRSVGWLGYCIAPRVRRVGMANLDLAYGDALSLREKRRILRGVTENMGIVAAEFSRIPLLRGEDLSRFVHVEGMDHLPEDKGAVILCLHQANWEWMAPALRVHRPKVGMVVRPLDDPRLNTAVDAMRCSTGVVTIPHEGAGNSVFRLLREGYIIGIMGDQAPRSSAVPANFFGNPCWATAGPVMIAMRAKVPLLLATMARRNDGGYTQTFHAPFELTRSSDLRADLVVNTQRCQDAIEVAVRAHPEQWLWLHRRWKKRARLEKEWNQKL